MTQKSERRKAALVSALRRGPLTVAQLMQRSGVERQAVFRTLRQHPELFDRDESANPPKWSLKNVS